MRPCCNFATWVLKYWCGTYVPCHDLLRPINKPLARLAKSDFLFLFLLSFLFREKSRLETFADRNRSFSIFSSLYCFCAVWPLTLGSRVKKRKTRTHTKRGEGGKVNGDVYVCIAGDLLTFSLTVTTQVLTLEPLLFIGPLHRNFFPRTRSLQYSVELHACTYLFICTCNTSQQTTEEWLETRHGNSFPERAMQVNGNSG